jgi:hypothetical protein
MHYAAIHDRFAPVSEACYGMLVNGWQAIDILTVISLLNRMNPLIIYCSHFDAEMQHHEVAPHDKGEYLVKVKENYRKIRKRYDLIMSATIADVINYDFSKNSNPDDLDAMATKVVKKLQRR